MKITIEQVAENGNSVSSAIEAACKDHDSIASGVIGPSFATSGPGPGWSRQYDVSDYAERALSGDYGASSYIDSSDGREATLGEDGELEWSDESVIELVCPSLEEAMENKEAYEAMLSTLTIHCDQTDLDAWETLEEHMANPYQVRDSAGVTEYASDLEELAGIIEDWYDHLDIDQMPAPDLDYSSLDSLVSTTKEWENRIAEVMGAKEFAGHGSYHVSAADSIGLSLAIRLRD